MSLHVSVVADWDSIHYGSQQGYIEYIVRTGHVDGNGATVIG